MSKKIISMLLALIMAVSLIAIPAQADSSLGAATTSALNLRSGAGTSYSIILTIPNGSDILVLSTSNGWSKVIYNNTEGYVSAQYTKAKSEVSGRFGVGTITGGDVRMRSGAGTGYSILGTYAKGTVMTVTGAKDNWYKVSYNGTTGYVISDYMTVTTSVTSFNAAPVLKLGITASNGKPTLTWDAVNGAAKYYIYRGTDRNSYIKWSECTGTKYTNTSAVAGTTYYYKIKAVSAGGATSEYSNSDYITCDCAQPVVSICNSISMGKPTISWNAVDGATKYIIYRSTDGNNYGYWSETAGTKYINSSANAGTTYYYKVKAVSSKSSYADSALSSAKYITCDCAQPVVSITLDSDGHPKLSWKAISGASKYYIYRSTDGKNYTYWDYTGYTSFTNRNSVVSGMHYYYKVRAISSVSSDAHSQQSKAVSIYVDSDKDKVLADAVISTAKSYLGVPYVYGGMSPSGFDCSGFTAYVYSQHGYAMPHSASMQFENCGVSVSKSELRPGDLVFFHDGVDKTTAGHAGIYIGNDQFIHASSSKGQVVIESMSTTYRIEHYIGAKRLIGTQ